MELIPGMAQRWHHHQDDAFSPKFGIQTRGDDETIIVKPTVDGLERDLLAQNLKSQFRVRRLLIRFAPLQRNSKFRTKSIILMMVPSLCHPGY